MANLGSQLPVSAKAPPAGSMFSLGWLMAQLFGQAEEPIAADPDVHCASDRA